MINFTGIIKAKMQLDTAPKYINTNSIKYVMPLGNSSYVNYDISDIYYTDNSYHDSSNIPPEIWAKAILKAEKSDEIIDIEEFAKAEENKLDIEG